MQPYNYIYHIINDIINECTKYSNAEYLCFANNLRYDNKIDIHRPYRTLLCNYEVNKTFPDIWRWNVDLYSDESWSVYAKGSWANALKAYDHWRNTWHWLDSSVKEKEKNHFVEHCWEPICYELDHVFWKDLHKIQHNLNVKHTIVHSEHNSWDVNQLESQGIKTVHWFAHAYLCSEFYFKHYSKLKMVTDYKSRPIRYHWVCANRLIDGPRQYRLDFLNCIDTSKGIYSLLDKDPYTNRTLEEICPNNKVLPNSFDDHINSSAEIKVDDLTPWNTSFLHIVNETVWQEKIHFTEKVFKPIVLHQPFVVLQAPGSLAYLRSYGFKTFGAWWDESYDTIEDPTERMQAIADIVNSIGNKSLDELETMRMEMASVLEHNFRHFYENIPAICLDELREGIATL